MSGNETTTEYRAYGESGPDYDGQGRVICPPEEAYGPWTPSRMAAVSYCRWFQGHANVGVETREVERVG